MGLDNPLHIAFLVVILLLVFGAKRLPEIGRSLGSGMREFKQSVTGQGEPEQLNAAPQPAATPQAQVTQAPAVPAPAPPAAAPAAPAAPTAPVAPVAPPSAAEPSQQA